MKKCNFIILLFFLLLTISCVSAHENENYTLSDSNQPLLDDANYANNVSQPSKIETHDLIKYYKNDSQFEFSVFDDNDKPVSNASVLLNVNGVNYTKTTNDEGFGFLTIGLNPGKYKITTTCGNKSNTNLINVLSRVSSKDVSSTYGKTAKFNLKVVDKKGNPMKNELVAFKVNGKTYKKFTNSNGIATLSLNLNAGTYTITYSVDGISGKNKYHVKNYFKITTYKWKSGADITKNKMIKANIPNSALVKKIVKAAKLGTPVIKFKGGKGKAVFITAGVHGNEISSQVAAMKLIEYLETHPIKGTVYIMPFMNPKGIASNVRDYAGVHLNKKANVKGTISYKTVKLIIKFKCKAYGDFHCTRPGGKPGKDVAMGTYKPTAKSATLAKYIAKKSKVKYIIYKKAGTEYPGALEDVVSLKGIPAVTCEVITPHGTVAKGSVSKSLSMMKSLLKFNSLL
ncbi:succinylglutamate desuccinylase/aspartoacylase family protein [Methanobrevibacter sp.]|uniref:succinylglutamate desuccinylase/aspartoacylase domain-containing protein n=1 Tax=Methanobrevibacter sp. TaxID=66852 RepID=UPI0038663876